MDVEVEDERERKRQREHDRFCFLCDVHRQPSVLLTPAQRRAVVKLSKLRNILKRCIQNSRRRTHSEGTIVRDLYSHFLRARKIPRIRKHLEAMHMMRIWRKRSIRFHLEHTFPNTHGQWLLSYAFVHKACKRLAEASNQNPDKETLMLAKQYMEWRQRLVTNGPFLANDLGLCEEDDGLLTDSSDEEDEEDEESRVENVSASQGSSRVAGMPDRMFGDTPADCPGAVIHTNPKQRRPRKRHKRSPGNASTSASPSEETSDAGPSSSDEPVGVGIFDNWAL